MMATHGKECSGVNGGATSGSSNGCSEVLANKKHSVVVNGGAAGDSCHPKPINGEAGRAERFTFTAEPTIEDIRRMQAEFTDERDWNQFHQPRNLLLAMVGEVGEVSELFQWRGEVAEGLPNWTEAEREQLAHELSDVLIYLVELAEKCHVDLPQAVLRKMALNRLKYPASKVHGSAKKYTEYQD
ncbi:glutamyl-tRNA(Gln) amidotransferase subunit B, mitochondrial [Cheilinus undulatus]|uniref:glutamyl-tRNA(Gln) amidotransferase subunit B, mitochondrial n=1 Tax=Cheilinus undulatus TaxID=241271 RepID=UPI001BD5FD54|nr:glutamyl-tRNA(Gln) amidotransferase subunit B, mitochondrial [Cheilinus undulatus]